MARKMMNIERRTASPLQVFKDLRILVLPIAIGKKRLSLFESQIKKEGGAVCSLNEVRIGQVSPTHIVVEDSLIQKPDHLQKYLKSLEYKGVIVGTRWLSDSIKQQRCMQTEAYQYRANLMQEMPSSSDSNGCTSPKKLKLNTDPVQSTHELKPSGSKELSVLDVNNSSVVKEAEGENELIITELQKLADAFRNKGDTWRAHGYRKAVSAIKSCGKVLNSYEDAIALPGIGKKMALKVWEIVETGSLRKVSEVCEDEKTCALKIFTDIWGVGPSTAESWYQQGCRTLNDLKEKEISLSKQQLIGLNHYADFLERIPRIEVEKIGHIVFAAAKAIEPLLSASLVGSYRRGKSFCGDIDVMVIKPDNMNSTNILSQLLLNLKDTGFITDDLVSIEKEGNQRKYLGVCRLPGENEKYRRLDIFVVPKSESATAFMHYTGSALFNRSIRLLAAKKGMSLSEHCLRGGIVREGMKVLNDGFLIPTPTEASIFEALGLEYRAPEERDH